jgi:hypothetical protein
MPPIPDSTVFQRTLATLPLETYERDETVIAAGSKTGRLPILRKGASLRLLVARRTESNLPTDCGGEA